MSITSPSSRRSFIVVAGAALSGPMAAAAAGATALVGNDSLDPQARLAMLEDANAIRALNQAYARHVNAGEHEALAALFADSAEARPDPEIRVLEAYRFGDRDAIEIAADRQSASALVHCTVRIETPIDGDHPLVQMARAQGGGVISRTETGVFENAYVTRDGGWKIRRSVYRPV